MSPIKKVRKKNLVDRCSSAPNVPDHLRAAVVLCVVDSWNIQASPCLFVLYFVTLFGISIL
jgi:hypothetical protein